VSLCSHEGVLWFLVWVLPLESVCEWLLWFLFRLRAWHFIAVINFESALLFLFLRLSLPLQHLDFGCFERRGLNWIVESKQVVLKPVWCEALLRDVSAPPDFCFQPVEDSQSWSFGSKQLKEAPTFA